MPCDAIMQKCQVAEIVWIFVICVEIWFADTSPCVGEQLRFCARCLSERSRPLLIQLMPLSSAARPVPPRGAQPVPPGGWGRAPLALRAMASRTQRLLDSPCQARVRRGPQVQVQVRRPGLAGWIPEMTEQRLSIRTRPCGCWSPGCGRNSPAICRGWGTPAAERGDIAPLAN